MLSMPWQNPDEWLTFMHIVECHLKYAVATDWRKPVAVEIGVFQNRQKAFYEALGMEHIGIDADRESEAEIIGDSHSDITVQELVKRLAGRFIAVLFIDGDHRYVGVKDDYERYGALTRGIVALHDIYNWKYGVKDFWAELVAGPSCRDKTFITIHAAEGYANHGIGVIK